jgi:hypothetical protein
MVVSAWSSTELVARFTVRCTECNSGETGCFPVDGGKLQAPALLSRIEAETWSRFLREARRGTCHSCREGAKQWRRGDSPSPRAARVG